MHTVRAEVRELAPLREDGAVFVAHDAAAADARTRPIARFGGRRRYQLPHAPNGRDVVSALAHLLGRG